MYQLLELVVRALEVRCGAILLHEYTIDQALRSSQYTWIGSCHDLRHALSVTYEWDNKKAASNERKHGIRFEDAVLVFDDPAAITWMDDRAEYGEAREITLGAIEAWVILVVVHTDRAGVTRIIPARPANRKERNRYYESCANQA